MCCMTWASLRHTSEIGGSARVLTASRDSPSEDSLASVRVFSSALLISSLAIDRRTLTLRLHDHVVTLPTYTSVDVCHLRQLAVVGRLASQANKKVSDHRTRRVIIFSETYHERYSCFLMQL